LENKVDAILLPWQPGQEGGILLLTFSQESEPSGKLTMTFPVNYEDTPSAKTGLELLPTTQQVSHMKKGFILVTVTLTLLTYNLLMNLDTDYRIPHSIILILH
jgi:hypothetical protein